MNPRPTRERGPGEGKDADRGGGAPRVSLKARALKLLAQREHSRAELRRKLMPHAIAACEARAAGAASTSAAPAAQLVQAAQAASVPPLPRLDSAPIASPDGADEDTTPGPCLDRLLDWLEARGYLSAERFVESRVHARAARFGQRRIALELAQHGLQLDASTAATLKHSEFARAHAVWQRRFGDQPATERSEQARQARFLAARGFSMDVIQRIVRGLGGDTD